jgi:adenine-specific DNA-methyltransferase
VRSSVLSIVATSPEGIGAEQDDVTDEEDNGADEDEEESADIVDIEHEELPFPAEEIGDWELRHARRRGSESSYRHQRKNQFYPIYIDVKQKRVVYAGPPLLPVERHPNFAKVDGLLPVWPIDKEKNDRCWRFISSEMQKLIEAGRVKLGVQPDLWQLTLNIWERKPESKKLKTVWWKKAHDAGTHGTTLLHNISVAGRRSLL